jgi:HEAT repeat protein
MAFIKRTADRADAVAVPADGCAALLEQLLHADAQTRRWAARDLVQYPQATAALVARLQSEDDLSVREIILTSLTRLGNETAVTGLVACLRSEEAQLRNEAIEAMKALPLEVAPIMRGLLLDEDADVRIMSLNVLESLRHPQVERWLIEVIERDTVVNVCATAVDLLGEVGTPASDDALQALKLRFRDEPYIQFSADIALKRIGKM